MSAEMLTLLGSVIVAVLTGGIGVKVFELLSGNSFRDELRKEIDRLSKRVTDLDTKVNSLEAEVETWKGKVEEWRTKYYTLQEKYQKAILTLEQRNALVRRLVNHVKELRSDAGLPELEDEDIWSSTH